VFGCTISVKDNVRQRKKLSVGALPPSEQDGYYVTGAGTGESDHVLPVLLARWQRSHTQLFSLADIIFDTDGTGSPEGIVRF